MNVSLRAYYAEGSKTLAYEIAEQLGWELPDVVVAPIASGSLFSKVQQGFDELLRLGLVDGPAASAPRRPGGGLLAGRDGVRRRRAREAGAAGHGRALARDRQPGRRRLRRRGRARDGRRHPRRARGGDRPRTSRCSPRRPASSARRRRRDARARSARRSRAGEVGARGPRRPARHRRRPEDAGARRRRVCSRSRSSRTPTRCWSGSSPQRDLNLSRGKLLHF